MKPFQQQPFASLPETPTPGHSFLELPTQRVTVSSAPFGRVDCAYRDVGSGPPLVLIHGLMTTGYSWRYVVPALAKHFRVLVPDLVGCGDSDKPAADYRALDVARFIGDWLDALDVRGAAVVGNSMGGYLCMWLALDQPDAMRWLINIHSPGIPLARLQLLRTALSMPGSRRLLSWLIDRDPQRWAHRNVHYWDESRKSLEEARLYAAPLQQADGQAAFANYLANTLDPADMRRFVKLLAGRDFPVPLQLLYARRDPMVPPAVGSALAAAIPSAELIWLDDCSHFAQVDKPQRIVDVIHAFARTH